MRADALTLTEAQRRAIGSRLEHMDGLVGELRSAGFDDERLLDLEDLLRLVRSETAAIAPDPPRNEIPAALARLFVLAMEIGPRQLKAYGPLDGRAAARLDERPRRFGELVTELIEEHETGGRAGAVRADPRGNRR